MPNPEDMTPAGMSTEFTRAMAAANRKEQLHTIDPKVLKNVLDGLNDSIELLRKHALSQAESIATLEQQSRSIAIAIIAQHKRIEALESRQDPRKHNDTEEGTPC